MQSNAISAAIKDLFKLDSTRKQLQRVMIDQNWLYLKYDISNAVTEKNAMLSPRKIQLVLLWCLVAENTCASPP